MFTKTIQLIAFTSPKEDEILMTTVGSLYTSDRVKFNINNDITA